MRWRRLLPERNARGYSEPARCRAVVPGPGHDGRIGGTRPRQAGSVSGLYDQQGRGTTRIRTRKRARPGFHRAARHRCRKRACSGAVSINRAGNPTCELPPTLPISQPGPAAMASPAAVTIRPTRPTFFKTHGLSGGLSVHLSVLDWGTGHGSSGVLRAPSNGFGHRGARVAGGGGDRRRFGGADIDAPNRRYPPAGIGYGVP